MTAKDFNERVKNLPSVVSEVQTVEYLKAELQERGITSVFTYDAWSEKNFERNLREDYERKTTFTSDLSIAEWIGGRGGVLDTVQRAAKDWKNDIEYFAELLLALNLKAWEMHHRKNYGWSRFYSILYYTVRDLYFDWYDEENEQHTEAVRYYYNYID